MYLFQETTFDEIKDNYHRIILDSNVIRGTTDFNVLENIYDLEDLLYIEDEFNTEINLINNLFEIVNNTPHIKITKGVYTECDKYLSKINKAIQIHKTTIKKKHKGDQYFEELSLVQDYSKKYYRLLKKLSKRTNEVNPDLLKRIVKLSKDNHLKDKPEYIKVLNSKYNPSNKTPYDNTVDEELCAFGCEGCLNNYKVSIITNDFDIPKIIKKIIDDKEIFQQQKVDLDIFKKNKDGSLIFFNYLK